MYLVLDGILSMGLNFRLTTLVPQKPSRSVVVVSEYYRKLISYNLQVPSTLQQFAALSLNPVGRASLHRSASSSSAFSDISFSSDSSYSPPTGPSTSLSLGFEDFVASPADDSDDEGDIPPAVFSRSPRRPTVARTTTGRSVSYSAVESELFSRDLFSYFDDDDDSSDSSFESSSANEDTFF